MSSRSSAPGGGRDQRAAQSEFDFNADSSSEEPLGVGELLNSIADALEAGFARVFVVGELSSFKRAVSGHCYFSLSDDQGSIDAVMWRGEVGKLDFEPSVGDQVVCRGRIGVYEKQGRMQLYASTMQPVGAGAAQRALEQLKRRLAGEGLFALERKRALPYLPATIGLVTSRSGAALHDMLTTLKRRFRGCRVVLSAAAVQGGEAPRELVEALAALERLGGCDVVIIGRGGGAAEDLAAFNDEAVVRAVAGFPVPVVSAVGHEVDYTLCDLAADVRAATPTAAAEAVVPVHAELAEEVASLELRLDAAVRRHIDHLRQRVGSVAGGLRDPASLVASARQRTDELFIRLERALGDRHSISAARAARLRDGLHALGRGYCERLSRHLGDLDTRLHASLASRRLSAETQFASLSSKLTALSPLAVLERGYSLASTSDGSLVRSSEELASGDELSLRFAKGSARTRVISTEGE